MIVIRNVLIFLLFCSTTAIAAPASENSIKELLAVTQVQKIIDGVRAQFDSLMNNVVEQELKGKIQTPRQSQAIANLKNRVVALMQGELAWEKLEPMYLRLYKESFSQEEVDSMLSFYKTQGGQAVIHKMPSLMQKSMLEVQKMLSGVTPKMEKIREDFIAELTAAKK